MDRYNVTLLVSILVINTILLVFDGDHKELNYSRRLRRKKAVVKTPLRLLSLSLPPPQHSFFLSPVTPVLFSPPTAYIGYYSRTFMLDSFSINS